MKLEDNVITSNRCRGCAACFVGCPFEDVLDFKNGPKLVGECKECGICVRICPAYSADINQLEDFTFGHRRNVDSPLGIFLSSSVGKALDSRITASCQDGGIATALLLTGIEKRVLDGVIVSSTDATRPWLPKPQLAKSADGIIGAAGTRYSYSAGLPLLQKSVKAGMDHIAFVGPPCQINAIRKMQKAGLRRVVGNVAVTIGLFCSESFRFEELMLDRIQGKMGVDLASIVKMNVKRRLLITLRSGEVLEIPLKELRQYSEPFCKSCPDFSAELADISLGGVGLEGKTLVVTRTEAGKKFVDLAADSGMIELNHPPEEQIALDLAIRLSRSKREKAGSLPLQSERSP